MREVLYDIAFYLFEYFEYKVELSFPSLGSAHVGLGSNSYLYFMDCYFWVPSFFYFISSEFSEEKKNYSVLSIFFQLMRLWHQTLIKKSKNKLLEFVHDYFFQDSGGYLPIYR